MADSRVILPTGCQVLAGMAYGLSQPTLMATVEVAAQRQRDWRAADALLDSLFEEPWRAADEPPDPVQQVLWRLAQLQGAVQRQVKIPVFGAGRVVACRAVAQGAPVRALLALPCHSDSASRVALQWAAQALEALLAPGPLDGQAQDSLRAGLAKCTEQLRPHGLQGINMQHFVRSAHELGIPVSRVLPDVYCFGLGAHGRLLSSSLTDQTPAIATGIAHRKSATATVLRQHGIPVPRHLRARSEQEALQAAQQLGYPVVVKPDDQEQGRGVAAGLRDAAAVAAAYGAAASVSRHVLVEKHHEGEDYRLTVFRDKVVKILHRKAGGLTGDGVHDIAALLALEHQTPRFQRVFRQHGRMSLELDDEALGLLAERGLTAASVPARGVFVPLRRKANISAGGIQSLVPLDQAHPDNLALAVRASRAIRLDLCGVDLLIPDIARSWHDSGAVIIELNAQPQIGWTQGPEAYPRILTELLQGRWHIPLALCICAAGESHASPQEIAACFGGIEANAFTSASGVWIDGELITRNPGGGFEAAAIALAAAATRSAACVMSIDEVVAQGLPAARFDRIACRRPAGLSAPDELRWRWMAGMVRAHAAGGVVTGVAQEVSA